MTADNVLDTRASRKSRAADSFTCNQFEWLRQVAADSDLPNSSSRMAIALTKYFSRREGGWAWMKQVTLANDLNISERAVSDAIVPLIDRGHLIREQRGKKLTNRYRIALQSDRQEPADHKPSDQQESADHRDEVTGRFSSSDQQESAGVTGKNLLVHMNPLNEPTAEHTEARGAPPARPRQAPSVLKETSNPNDASPQARGGTLDAPAAPKLLNPVQQIPQRRMITMSNVLPFKRPEPEEMIEPDHESEDETDVYGDLGYRRHHSEQHEVAPAPASSSKTKSHFDIEFEKNFGPWEEMVIPKRPPGWKPPVDPDEDLPF